MSNTFSANFGFHQAEIWFNGNTRNAEPQLSSKISAGRLREADQLLSSLEVDTEFKQLLPYVLEEHGPGSRASVMKEPTTAMARAAKRKAGVFYTPSDVADYMVEQVRQLYRGEFLTAKVLDPACGTGVFLLALLRAAARQHGEGFSRFNYVTSCLHGCDLSGHALDAAAFILLIECLTEVKTQGIRPQLAWQLIRRNLVQIDSVSVHSVRHADTCPSRGLFANSVPRLSALFPEVHDGFDILIGNPPYATLGTRGDYQLLATRFASLKGVRTGPRVNLFPLFVEMMWQFTKPGCNAAALVTPLSIAFHSGVQFRNCRRAMTWAGGRWRFAFFDREPHALFGEEVKTRNAILFHIENSETPKPGQTADIETSPLRKWTSRTRVSLFKRIDFTPLGSLEITTGIPKLSGTLQAKTLMALRRTHQRLPMLALKLATCAPVEAMRSENAPKVFVGGTAYNFLNVYRPIKLRPDESGYLLSRNPVHCLRFKSQADASAAFAILSSRLVFWLWHVLGDGFHVTSGLFKAIPFAKKSFSQEQFDSLSRLGDLLWEKLQNHRFMSVNHDRLTIGFRPLACHEERNGIDAILVKAAKLNKRVATELRQFVHENTVVDLTDEQRNHIP
jgi:methylase of polypeptide subunit release factors